MKFRTLQTQNSPGRWAQVPCSAAGTAEFPRFRGQPPPHPLAPRAFAFAWRRSGLRGQTRRVQKPRRCFCAGIRFCWRFLSRLSVAWCGFSPVFGCFVSRIDVCTILPELFCFFKRKSAKTRRCDGNAQNVRNSNGYLYGYI